MTNSNKHAVLAQIDSELLGVQVAEPVELGGHTYSLKVLERHEESYGRTLFPPDTNALQAFADQSLPMLSVALQSVDSVLVEELFVPDADISAETRLQIQTEEGMLRWRREQVLSWFNSKPGPFVEALWFKYLELKRESQDRLEQLRPLSNPTPSGESKPTSSPEKESSLATPASPA